MHEYREWLVSEESDLKTAKRLLDADEEFVRYIAHYAQQGAEKLLKAFLVFKKIGVRKDT